MNTSPELIYLGSSPADETCAQLGGPEPSGVRLRIKTSHHDFGIYLDVVAEVAADASQAALAYATRCGAKASTTWDREALAVLGKAAT